MKQENKVRPNDEGLTLETLAFQIVHGGNSIFINTFDNTTFSFLKVVESGLFEPLFRLPRDTPTCGMFLKPLKQNSYHVFYRV